MRIYQVHNLHANGTSRGYTYFANRKDAKRASKEYGKPYGEINNLDVDISRPGIINALNIYGGHPDNGELL